jgi:hypothetical protein
VFLGGSSRLVKILRVCGVGRNFFKMSVKELGDVLEVETTVQQMIVSFAPTISFHLTFFQRIKQRFFGHFLKLMRDFAESSGDGLGDIIEDDEESGMPGPDYAQLLGELFRSLCGEDDSDSTLVNDQAVSIGESQIIG